MEFHGQEMPEFLGTKKGRLYLTTHRMIFNAKDQREKMQSFSFPFITLREVEVEQPMFGANYIKGKCRAQPNGNWIGECKFKLHFKSGGAIEFGSAMLRAAQLGIVKACIYVAVWSIPEIAKSNKMIFLHSSKEWPWLCWCSSTVSTTIVQLVRSATTSLSSSSSRILRMDAAYECIPGATTRLLYTIIILSSFNNCCVWPNR